MLRVELELLLLGEVVVRLVEELLLRLLLPEFVLVLTGVAVLDLLLSLRLLDELSRPDDDEELLLGRVVVVERVVVLVLGRLLVLVPVLVRVLVRELVLVLGRLLVLVL